MKKAQADFITDALSCTGVECSVQEDYSGRGMYGQETLGVVVSCSEMELLGYLVEHARRVKDDTPYMHNLRSDQMGKGSIVIY